MELSGIPYNNQKGDPPMTITITLAEEIRSYERIERELADHAEAGKTLARSLKSAELRVIDAFAEAEVTDMSVDGRRWKPEFKTIVSPATGQADNLVRYISEHGGEDLIQPSMHHSRRDAWVRERCIDDDGNVVVPPEMEGLVQTFDSVKLTKRKL